MLIEYAVIIGVDAVGQAGNGSAPSPTVVGNAVVLIIFGIAGADGRVEPVR